LKKGVTQPCGAHISGTQSHISQRNSYGLRLFGKNALSAVVGE